MMKTTAVLPRLGTPQRLLTLPPRCCRAPARWELTQPQPQPHHRAPQQRHRQTRQRQPPQACQPYRAAGQGPSLGHAPPHAGASASALGALAWDGQAGRTGVRRRGPGLPPAGAHLHPGRRHSRPWRWVEASVVGGRSAAAALWICTRRSQALRPAPLRRAARSTSTMTNAWWPKVQAHKPHARRDA